MDNSTILLLRLLNEVDGSRICIAGFDGYEVENNYAEQNHEYNMCVAEIKTCADFISTKRGGDGAVREFIDWLIAGCSSP